jgi:hypothetical protein
MKHSCWQTWRYHIGKKLLLLLFVHSQAHLKSLWWKGSFDPRADSDLLRTCPQFLQCLRRACLSSPFLI